MSSNEIQRQVHLRANRHAVWQALTDSHAFGDWFGAKVEGPFEAGRTVRATVEPTKVDADVAKGQEFMRGIEYTMQVERLEPERLFSFRWHPADCGPGKPYVPEPTSTLVVFELVDTPGGTLLTVTESGFDQIPAERRARLFDGNAEGWEIQMNLIAQYLAHAE
jgi:uncharacterized protein YndB with AHSA1/START domain